MAKKKLDSAVVNEIKFSQDQSGRLSLELSKVTVTIQGEPEKVYTLEDLIGASRVDRVSRSLSSLIRGSIKRLLKRE